MTGRDQAHGLRDAVIKKETLISQEQQDSSSAGPRVICISSGKGGVGKSNFTLNLALAIRKKGKRVIVIDADLGLANIEILLGILPKYSLLDVVEGNRSIEEVITEGPEGIGIISGASGIQMMSELSEPQLKRLLAVFLRLRDLADYVLIDTGAGISKSVISFVEASHELIVITTPEPPAIADAYALVKVLLEKQKDKKISLVINRVLDEKEAAGVFSKLSSVAERFLDKKLNYLGYLCSDENVSKAVRSQKPFYLAYPKTRATGNVDLIAMSLLQMKMEERGFHQFMNKLKGFFFSGGQNVK